MILQTIWVITERNAAGELTAPSLELISGASKLAGSLSILTWGDTTGVAADAGARGAAHVMTIGDVDPGAGPSALAAAVADAVREAGSSGPQAIFIPHTYDGRDVAARLSVRLDTPVLTNVVGITAEDGALVTEHAIFGGTKLLKAKITEVPGIYCVRPKTFADEPADGRAPATPGSLPVPDIGRTGDVTLIGRHVESRQGPALDQAPVVVSGGRGLGEASNYEMVERLAQLLGGAPGASRAIVDAGWVPYSHQVGQTGKTVKPNLYVAVGISGATQHMVGMKSSRKIIAINKDEEAPIFAISDLGVVGDATKILPRLIEALEARSS